jgi:hypothetical protein
MSFIDTIKNWLNIGGVSMKLNVPLQLSESAGVVKGSVVLTTKSTKHITGISVDLVETFTHGRGDDEQTDTYKWGELDLEQEFDLNPGETKEIQFELPFTAAKSTSENLAKQKGIIGGLGKLSMMADNQKSTFEIEAYCNVKGSLGASEKVSVKMA